MNKIIYVILNTQEYKYLKSKDFFYKNFENKISVKKDCFLLSISSKEADALRDFCGEQLQTEGFNEKYELTDKGIILENLIDKLFIE